MLCGRWVTNPLCEWKCRCSIVVTKEVWLSWVGWVSKGNWQSTPISRSPVCRRWFVEREPPRDRDNTCKRDPIERGCRRRHTHIGRPWLSCVVADWLDWRPPELISRRPQLNFFLLRLKPNFCPHQHLPVRDNCPVGMPVWREVTRVSKNLGSGHNNVNYSCNRISRPTCEPLYDYQTFWP